MAVKKEWNSPATGNKKDANFKLTCATIGIAEVIEKYENNRTRTDKGAEREKANNEILSTELSENMIIKVENNFKNNEKEEATK